MTSVDGNKGAGVDQNKRGHLADESEACWVIKEGRCRGLVWLDFLDNTTHCVLETKSLLCEGAGM